MDKKVPSAKKEEKKEDKERKPTVIERRDVYKRDPGARNSPKESKLTPLRTSRNCLPGRNLQIQGPRYHFSYRLLSSFFLDLNVSLSRLQLIGYIVFSCSNRITLLLLLRAMFNNLHS